MVSAVKNNIVLSQCTQIVEMSSSDGTKTGNQKFHGVSLLMKIFQNESNVLMLNIPIINQKSVFFQLEFLRIY